MRTLMVFLAVTMVVVLGGCGSYSTLEELEQEAMLTGDWSRVEQRERILAKRAMRIHKILRESRSRGSLRLHRFGGGPADADEPALAGMARSAPDQCRYGGGSGSLIKFSATLNNPPAGGLSSILEISPTSGTAMPSGRKNAKRSMNSFNR